MLLIKSSEVPQLRSNHKGRHSTVDWQKHQNTHTHAHAHSGKQHPADLWAATVQWGARLVHHRKKAACGWGTPAWTCCCTATNITMKLNKSPWIKMINWIRSAIPSRLLLHHHHSKNPFVLWTLLLTELRWTTSFFFVSPRHGSTGVLQKTNVVCDEI